jgi:hypothetical protein
MPDWVYNNINSMKVYLLELEDLEKENMIKLLLEGELLSPSGVIEKEIRWKLKINSVISYVSENRSNLKMPHVKYIDQCFDKTVLYEMRIKISDYLLRLFFVCYLDKIIIYNFLVKPYKYEKQIKRRVDKDYEEKILKAKEYHSQLVQGQTNLIKYIKMKV